jgi:hypothetical protein
MQVITAEQQLCCSHVAHAAQPAHVVASGESMHELPLLPLLLAAAPQMGGVPLPLLLDELPPELLPELLLDELLLELPVPEALPLLDMTPLLVPEPLPLEEPVAPPELLLPLAPPVPAPLPVEDPLPLVPPLLVPPPLLPLPDVLLPPSLTAPPSGESPVASLACPWAQAHAKPDNTAKQTTYRFMGEPSFLELRNAWRVGHKAQLRLPRKVP